MNSTLPNLNSQRTLGIDKNEWNTSFVDHLKHHPVPRLESPFLVITQQILEEANKHLATIQLHNDRANLYDSLTGSIGEIAFAQWMFKDLHAHNLGKNFGNGDFDEIEIKTSLTLFNHRRHLVAKESYVRDHPSTIYVQCFISSRTPWRGPLLGDTVFIAGWTDHQTLISHGFRCNETTRSGKNTGIKTFRLPLSKLQPMHSLPRIASLEECG